MQRKPYVWSLGTGIFEIISSDNESYCIATPLDGLDDDNFHGGSIMIISNKCCPIYNCLVLNNSKSKVLISVQIGIELSVTNDFFVWF